MTDDLDERIMRHLASAGILPAGAITDALGEPVDAVEKALLRLCLAGKVRGVAGAPGLFEAVWSKP
jgi:hypothetical protein